MIMVELATVVQSPTYNYDHKVTGMYVLPPQH